LYLQKRRADAPEIVQRDTDAGIGDLKHDVLAVYARTHGHSPAAVTELDGIIDQIDQYLRHGAPVGDDFRQATRRRDVERDADPLRPERQTFGATGDDGVKPKRLRKKCEIA